MTGPQAERRYGVEIESRKQLYGLQRMEEAYGMQVAEWAQEGMPIEAMGTPSQMEAFRERKGTPVPWNVEEHNEHSVQRSAEAAADTSPAGDAGVPESVRDVISSPGQSLDVSIQRAMEDRMGDSFSDVRVHAGPTAARACDQIDARAFTVGNHVAFNSGEYDPSSPEGQHVLAHELAHVRQQTGGAVSMLPKEDVELEIDPDPALEREAEETAQRVLAGGEVGIQRLADSEVYVQRFQGPLPSSTGTGGGGLPAHQNAREKYYTEEGDPKDRYAPSMPSISLEDVKAEFGLVDEQLRMLYADHFGSDLDQPEYDPGNSVGAMAFHLVRTAIASIDPALLAANVGYTGYQAYAEKTNFSAVEAIKELLQPVVEHARTGEGEDPLEEEKRS